MRCSAPGLRGICGSDHHLREKVEIAKRILFFDGENAACWPPLPLEEWKDTYATLRMWTQIVGKVSLALTPLVNHWWNVPLYVTSRGMSTSLIPYRDKPFELWFDFLEHQLFSN